MSCILKYSLFILLLLISNCASIGSPSGGELDKASPELISIFPENQINIKDDQTIKLIFNERINPLFLKSNIRIEPQVDVYINGKNNEIKISPVINWPDNFKIFISRKISDYHGNNLDSPIELLYSKSDFINTKKLNGQLFNIDNSKIYEVILIDENYLIISKTESDNLGNFTFTGISNIESLFILAIENVIKDNFKNNIRNFRYGMSNRSLNYDFNPIYISKSIYRTKVNNITLTNSHYGELNLSNGKTIPLILNYKKFSNQVYDNSKFIYLEHDFSDSLFLDFRYQNTIEEYSINSSLVFSKEIQDSIPPFILKNYVSNDSLLLQFSEPVSLNKKNQIFTQSDEEQIKTNIQYKYIAPDLVFLDTDNIEELNINCSEVKDLNYNNLCDSILVITNISIDQDDNNISLGVVNGDIIYNEDEKLIVEIVNTSNDFFVRQHVINNEFSFEGLMPGEYKIWVYEDINNINSNYFSGLLEPEIKRAAKFGIYPNNITVRGNWTNTITINLK